MFTNITLSAAEIVVALLFALGIVQNAYTLHKAKHNRIPSNQIHVMAIILKKMKPFFFKPAFNFIGSALIIAALMFFGWMLVTALAIVSIPQSLQMLKFMRNLRDNYVL